MLNPTELGHGGILLAEDGVGLGGRDRDVLPRRRNSRRVPVDGLVTDIVTVAGICEQGLGNGRNVEIDGLPGDDGGRHQRKETSLARVAHDNR